MKERLVELIRKAERNFLTNGTNIPQMAEVIVDYILADGWIRPPCKVGDTVYKIIKCCEKNKGYKEFYRPSVEFEEDCDYLDPQSWYDDCNKCKEVDDFDEACYCDLNVKIYSDACKERLAIQKEKFTFSMMCQVYNTPMFNENTQLEDTYFLTIEETERVLEGVRNES